MIQDEFKIFQWHRCFETTSKKVPNFCPTKMCFPNLRGSMNLLDSFMPRWNLSSNLVAVPLNFCSWFLGFRWWDTKQHWKQKEGGLQRRWIFSFCCFCWCFFFGIWSSEFYKGEEGMNFNCDRWSVAYQEHIWILFPPCFRSESLIRLGHMA